MRKIYFNPNIQDEQVFYSWDGRQDRIVVKNDNGVVERHHIDTHVYEGKNYSLADVIAIEQCNKALDTPMTDEEVEYMLTSGLGRPEKLTPDYATALAGYLIDKKIIQL